MINLFKIFKKDKPLFSLLFLILISIFFIVLFNTLNVFDSLKLSLNAFYFLFLTGYLILIIFLNKDFESYIERFFMSLILNIVILPFIMLILNLLFVPLSYLNIFIITTVTNLIFVGYYFYKNGIK